MKEKESYTFEELCTGLKMPMSKFCQLAGVTEGTMSRLRKGYSARRGTINTLLDTFSKVYGLEFSLENVSGLKPIEKPITPINEQADAQPIREPPIAHAPKEKVSQNRNVAQKGKTEFPIPDDLPAGTVKLIDFAKKYKIPESSMGRYVDPEAGIKKGKEWIPTTVRPKASGLGKQHFLTPEQQTHALEVLRQHGKLKENE